VSVGALDNYADLFHPEVVMRISVKWLNLNRLLTAIVFIDIFIMARHNHNPKFFYA